MAFRVPRALLRPDDIQRNAAAAVRVLRGHGVGPADRVMLKADNSTLYPAVLLALAGLGASIVLEDARQTAAETRRRAASARVRWAIVADVSGYDGPGSVIGMAELGARVAERPAAADVDLDLAGWDALPDAMIAWTSGSTAQPKGIVKSGASVLANLRRTAARMRYRSDDVLLPLLPFSHWYGLSLVFLAWMSGAALLVAPYRRLDLVMDAARRHGPTAVDATPATYDSLLRLLARRADRSSDFDRVRLWCVGGAPVPATLVDRFSATAGKPLLDGYGSTEAGNIALATPDAPHWCGTALDGVAVWITDDAGRRPPPGCLGEIVVASPDLMTGHLDESGNVRATAPGPYRTGDLGCLDPHGHVRVVGRMAAVHRSGHTLYPAAIEQRVGAIGQPVAVVPVDDERLGCRLVFVVEDPADRPATYWNRLIRDVLPPDEHPNQVLVLGALPINGNGKVDTRMLRHLARTRVGSDPGAGRH